MRVENEVSLNQLQATLNAIPGNHVFVFPDAPRYTIIGATDSFLEISYTTREQIIGKPLFEVFPDNATNEKATGASNLRNSLDQVVEQKKAHQMVDQRYDIINPTTGAFEFRVWAASNKPVLDTEGAIKCIIHTTEDITEKVRLLEENAIKEEQLMESESRFRRMVEQAPVPMLLSRGEDLIIERINEPMLRFMNKTSFDEVLGKSLIEALPELNNQEILYIVKNVQKTGVPFKGEEQPVDLVVNDQIKRQYFHFSYTPIIEAGQITGVLHVAVDITQQVEARKKVEEANRQIETQKRLYETVTNNTPDLIYVFDLSYRFTYANQALLDMWGKTWEQSVGKGLRENGYEEWHAQMHEREIDQVAATKNAVRGEVSFPHATLGKRVYDYILVPVLNDKGVVEAVAGTTRDITEHKLTEQTILESNERFRNLADESPMFVFLIDSNPLAPVSFWNKTWLQYTGQSEAEALGRAWDGIIHPDDVAIVMEYYVPAFQNQQPYLIPSVRVKRYDGEYRWHLFKGNPRYSSAGQFNGYVGVGFDVHEQKLATEALKESETRAKAAIEIARLGTFEIDVKEQTIVHSPRNAEILGLDPAKQWPYQKIIETVHPADRAIRFKALEEAKQTGVLFYEVRVLHPDRSVRWVRLNGRYIDQDKGPRIIGTLMDISEEKKTAEVLEQKVEERTKELKQANEQLKQFSYAASHDLQEPLRKISFFLDRLLSNIGPALSEDNRQITERIQHTVNRMRSLIDDLLVYSNTSLGFTGFEQVDLNMTVRGVLDDMEAIIIEKNALVEVQELPTVTGDPRQLRQLFQNIIGNALKYHKKSEPPQLDITCNRIRGGDTEAVTPGERNDEMFYLFEVKDNGIGFDPDDAERIFRLFQRLHGKAEYEGTGVGLAIVHQVIDNHKGFIWAESSPGQGSIFKLLLPVG